MWYKNYGLSGNPFFVRPSPQVVNLDKEKECLERYVASETISAIVGPHGSGKTSLLLWLFDRKKEARLLYLNGIETETKEKLKRELHSKRSIWDKLFRRKLPKNIVLLLDEAQTIKDSKFFELLRTYWDSRTLIAVVMSFSDSIKLPPGLISRLGNRIVKLEGLAPSAVSDLIKIRTNNKIQFDSDALVSISKIANYNPRKILEFCERCAVKFVGKKNKINFFDIKNIFRQMLSVRQAPQKDVLPKSPFVDQEKESSKIFLSGQTQPIRQKVRQEVRQLGRALPKSLPILSPLQNTIVRELKAGHQTLSALSLKLGKSQGSIGKELSRLTRRGIVIKIDEKKPKKYAFSEDYEF